ncbi:sugar ABC transporter permease [candidate division WOR-3 bacterium]|nr:sugar ABC transporter permease [candidate division WOR-3 bacterium]
MRITDERFGRLLLVPAILLVGVIAFYPILRNAILSFYKVDILSGIPPTFIGFKNFSTLLQDSRFLKSLGNTAYFTIVSVVIEFMLGLGFALLLNRTFRARNLVRATVLIPWALPTAVMAIGWRWIYNDVYGVLNDILLKLGIISTKIAWLGNPKTAMMCAIFADVWKSTPFVALILLAGLQSIPRELYEASELDGATEWTKFKLITFPLLLPSIALALLFRTLQAIGIFDLMWVLTGGGPAGTTETVSIYVYDYAYRYLRLGYASSAVTLTFMVILVIGVLWLRRK